MSQISPLCWVPLYWMWWRGIHKGTFTLSLFTAVIYLLPSLICQVTANNKQTSLLHCNRKYIYFRGLYYRTFYGSNCYNKLECLPLLFTSILVLYLCARLGAYQSVKTYSNSSLIALPANIRLGCERMAVWNTLAYFVAATITTVKSFIVQAPGPNVTILFTAVIY